MGRLESVNQWLTLLANFGVVAGIIFLAVEVRQNQVVLEQSQELMQREYDLEVAEGLKFIADSVRENSVPLIQDPGLMKLWLDGLAGKELSDVDQQRFAIMCNVDIWQSAVLRERMIALGRKELAKAEEQEFARKIRSDPGYGSCWEGNLPALRLWEFEDLITAVQALD